MKQGGNVATWHSLIEGFNAAGAFRKWRKTQPRLLAPSLGAAGKLKLRKGFPHSTRFGCRALIFPGADASVIRRTSQFCLLYRFIHSSSFLPSSYAVRPSSVYIGLTISMSTRVGLLVVVWWLVEALVALVALGVT